MSYQHAYYYDGSSKQLLNHSKKGVGSYGCFLLSFRKLADLPSPLKIPRFLHSKRKQDVVGVLNYGKDRPGGLWGLLGGSEGKRKDR